MSDNKIPVIQQSQISFACSNENSSSSIRDSGRTTALDSNVFLDKKNNVTGPSAIDSSTTLDVTGPSAIDSSTTLDLTGPSAIESSTALHVTGPSAIQSSTTLDVTGPSAIQLSTTLDEPDLRSNFSSILFSAKINDVTGPSAIQSSTTLDVTGPSAIRSSTTLDESDQTTATHMNNVFRVGDLCKIRYSVQKLFNVTGGNLFSQSGSASSSSSSASATPRNKMREKKRLCMVWSVEPVLQVLCTSTFDGSNINDENIIFDTLDRQFILKRVIAVFEKPTVAGQKSICAVQRSNGAIVNLNTYLILIPIIVHPSMKLSPPIGASFMNEHLSYIIDRVLQLSAEESSLTEENDSSDDDIPISRCSSIADFFMKRNSIMEWIKNGANEQ